MKLWKKKKGLKSYFFNNAWENKCKKKKENSWTWTIVWWLCGGHWGEVEEGMGGINGDGEKINKNFKKEMHPLCNSAFRKQYPFVSQILLVNKVSLIWIIPAVPDNQIYQLSVNKHKLAPGWHLFQYGKWELPLLGTLNKQPHRWPYQVWSVFSVGLWAEGSWVQVQSWAHTLV